VDLKTAVGRFSWAPDGSRIAFVAGVVIYTVRADGQRDTVICGTNLGHATPEGDDAFVDRFDKVAADRENVNGRAAQVSR
jgi:hypothetical protein